MVSTCKAWAKHSSNKMSNSSCLCACGSVVPLLGTEERLPSALVREVRPHPNRKGQCPYAARATSLCSLLCWPSLSGSTRVRSLPAYRSLRVHHHRHRRVIWTTAKDQKHRKYWLTNLERSPNTRNPRNTIIIFRTRGGLQRTTAPSTRCFLAVVACIRTGTY